MVANKDEIDEVLPNGFLGLLKGLADNNIPVPESEQEQQRFVEDIQAQAEEMAQYQQGIYARAILVVKDEHPCESEGAPENCSVCRTLELVIRQAEILDALWREHE